MKDILGRTLKEGDFIAYAKCSNRSAYLDVYEVRVVLPDKFKAYAMRKIRPGHSNWQTGDYDTLSGIYTQRLMTDAEIAKIKAKTSTLSKNTFVILQDFIPAVDGWE